METGTLKELNVKPGDVVECVCGSWHAKKGEVLTVNKERDIKGYSYGKTNGSLFRIISRTSDKPRTWGEMTPEEKGALLLAEHEGKVIEAAFSGKKWYPASRPTWDDEYAYRVRPEPEREVVKRYYQAGDSVFDTHRITFDLIDGKPDCASIKMEEL